MPMDTLHPQFNKGYAYAEFEKSEDALKATKFMHGGQIDGQEVKVTVTAPAPRYNNRDRGNRDRDRDRVEHNRSDRDRDNRERHYSPSRRARSPPRRQRSSDRRPRAASSGRRRSRFALNLYFNPLCTTGGTTYKNQYL